MLYFGVLLHSQLVPYLCAALGSLTPFTVQFPLSAALSVLTLCVWICVVCWVWISVCVPRKAPYRYLWILVASLTCASAMEPATALERERA